MRIKSYHLRLANCSNAFSKTVPDVTEEVLLDETPAEYSIHPCS